MVESTTSMLRISALASETLLGVAGIFNRGYWLFESKMKSGKTIRPHQMQNEYASIDSVATNLDPMKRTLFERDPSVPILIGVA